MLMAVQEPYALMVQQDDILINPRELDEPLGTMVCFHRRYALGDRHDFADKDAFLQKLYLDTVGNTPEGEASYEKLVDSFSNERAADNALLDVISEKYIVQPLYLLDHSGLAMQTTSFHDPWDSGQVGWIYVSKEAVQKAFEISELTEDDLQKARAMLDRKTANWKIAAGAFSDRSKKRCRPWQIIFPMNAGAWWNTWRNRIIRPPSSRRCCATQKSRWSRRQKPSLMSPGSSCRTAEPFPLFLRKEDLFAGRY